MLYFKDIAGQSPEQVEPEDEDDSDEEFKPSASKTTPTKKPAKRKVKKKKDNTPVKVLKLVNNYYTKKDT